MKPQKLRANENDTGIVECESCGAPIHLSSVSSLADANILVRVACLCGAITEVQYERRAFLRLLSSRPGTYRKASDDPTGGTMTVVDASVNGLQFRTAGAHCLEPNDIVVLEYDPGVKGCGRVRQEGVVQRVEGKLVGVKLGETE